MRERGFSLVEVLIILALAAIVTAIAIPNIRMARMAANETGAISNLTSFSMAEGRYFMENYGYGTITDLRAANMLDDRWSGAGVIDGYRYDEGQPIDGASPVAQSPAPLGFGVTATPVAMNGTGRYIYGIAADRVMRYLSDGPNGEIPGTPVGAVSSGTSGLADTGSTGSD